MKRPVHPYVVLLAACLLPGVGHLLLGQSQRGLIFALFVFLLGAFTFIFSTPDQSFVGQHAGGFFVWALSIPDAYRRARLAYVGAARL